MKHDIFHDASIKLATIYLFAIMGISLLFSFWLYNVSLSEIRQSVFYVPGPIQKLLLDDNPNFANELRWSQEQAVEAARNNLIYQLSVLNILIALGGATFSYLVARRTLDPIEKAHEQQRRFTADASHELRTPITAMRIENELALTDPKLTLKEARSQLESNIEELDKLTSLSESMLKLARSESKFITKERLSIQTVVEEAVSKVRAIAEKNSIVIVSKYPKKMDLMVDKITFIEAVVTILDNAIKFSPPDSKVHIAASATDDGLIIKIKDQGSGIAPNDVPHVFERFYRGDSSRTNSSVNGYGIGLSVAKASIEAHGGTISVASTPKVGTEFTITVPRN